MVTTLYWTAYALTVFVALLAGLRWIIRNDPCFAWDK